MDESTQPARADALGVAGMNWSYFLGYSFFRFSFRFYFGWNVLHPERVPLEGSVILAANHASYLDPLLIGSGLRRRMSYLARDSLFRYPGMGALLRSWHAVPVDREGGGAAGLRIILDRLEAGDPILLFPEGTRSRDGSLLPPKSGIGLTVAKSKAPVIPVRVFGTSRALGRSHWWPRPYPVTVHYGEPLLFEALRAEAKTCPKPRLKQIYQEISGEIMRAIEGLSDSPPTKWP